MAVKQTPKIRTMKQEYTRGQVLESLVYELKPFVVVAAGFAGGVYFTHGGDSFAKYMSLTLMACGLFILYARAKDRGVIQ